MKWRAFVFWLTVITSTVLVILVTVLTVVYAYTAPDYNDIDLELDASYTAPDYDDVDLVLDDAAVNTTCTISTTSTITSDLDCAGETFLVKDSAVATINSGVTVTCLTAAIESGSTIANAGTLKTGES